MLKRSTATRQRLTSHHFYREDGVLRVAIRYDDDQEEDRPATLLEAALHSEKAEKYAKDNPLGGPAKMFEAIASRIRAGEDYYAVLDDYDLQHKSPPSASEATVPVNKIVSVTRAFDYLGNNINEPWVKVCFKHEDWKGRDDFASALRTKP